MLRRHLLAAAAVLAALLTACGSEPAESCQDTPAGVLDGIAAGLNTADVTISSSGAVPYAGGLLVAGTLTGPGMDGDRAGWYVQELDPPGSISSANTMASEFSDWPYEQRDLAEVDTCLDE